MPTALITGSTGFIGSNLVFELLRQNWNISIIIRKESSLEIFEGYYHKLNIFKYDGNFDKLLQFFLVTNPDVVFHLAAQNCDESKPDNLNIMLESNIKFGVDILNAMSKSKVKYFICTSSFWVFDMFLKYDAVNFYASTKKAFDDILRYYTKQYNIIAISLVLFDTYGPNDKRNKLLNQILKSFKFNEKLAMTEGEQEIDLIHIKDVVNALISAYKYLSKNSFKYRQFWVGSKKPKTVKEVGNLISENFQRFDILLWGKIKYRDNQIIKLPSKYRTLPNWEPIVKIEDGIKELL